MLLGLLILMNLILSILVEGHLEARDLIYQQTEQIPIEQKVWNSLPDFVTTPVKRLMTPSPRGKESSRRDQQPRQTNPVAVERPTTSVERRRGAGITLASVARTVSVSKRQQNRLRRKHKGAEGEEHHLAQGSFPSDIDEALELQEQLTIHIRELFAKQSPG